MFPEEPWAAKVLLHPQFKMESSEVLLVELPASLNLPEEMAIHPPTQSDTRPLTQSDTPPTPLYKIDTKSEPPRLMRGNKEYYGRLEVLKKPLLVLRHEETPGDQCYITCVIREKIVFDKGPNYFW
eukprot:Blabericola_migrator_1__3256@NODE_195_length_11539_cov_221_635547_g168_i0_p9_GENE_NODE_195_length_11539_cov_221_635547_g168_i0NODE_195_length_11539_cov_221_635547_g168_i0_p9_ORF_typecomplete_len126_score26_27Ctf8/PF09696_10/1_3e05_NODE_195_length_11539_cov_221_635547_g168_i043934770